MLNTGRKKSPLTILTGTSSGIGEALARQLFRNNWNVIGLSSRRVDFGDVRYRHVCVGLWDVEVLREVGERELGALEEMDVGEVAGVFGVNVVAPMVLMGLVVRAAPAGAGIRIVNVSTGAAVRGVPGLSDYGSSKAALRMAGMTLAAELAMGERPGGPRGDVGILSYEPGVVDTAMQETARSGRPPWNEMFVELHAKGALVSPEGPAREIVEFLEKDEVEGFSERRFSG